MSKHTLQAKKRDLLGRSTKQLRQQGLVPAGVYGNGFTSANLQVNAKEFLSVYHQVGESSLLYLQTPDEPDRPVLVSEVVFNPVSGDLVHVGFHQVNLKEKVTAPVAVKIVGEAQAEKDKLGIMVQQLDEIEIEALPTDMPEGITVDVSSLSEVGSQILVSDLTLDPKLSIKTPQDSIIVKIADLAKEEVKEVTPTPETTTEAAPAADAAPAEESKAEAK